jgi:hypothetical protein
MKKFFTQRNIIIILFVVFLFLRLFVSSPEQLLGGDNLKYLETSKQFPNHTFYNNQLYLLHPPFYPYTIHFFNLIFQEDHIASIFISLLSAIITFFVIYHLFMMITNNFSLTFFVLVFYTLSDSLIIAGQSALRESFLIMLIFVSLYFFVKGVKFADKKSLTIGTIVGSILAISSDHVILLIPALGLSYLFWNRKKVELFKFKFPNLRYIVIPLLVILLFYGSWTMVKYVQYSKYDFYPNGHSGIPLNTQKVNLLGTIDPQFFEDFEGSYVAPGFISVVKRMAFNFGYMFNIEPLSIPPGLDFRTMGFLLEPKHVVYMFVLYFPLAIIMLYGLYRLIKDLLKDRKIYNNVHLYILLLFGIFVFPITQSLASPRYVFPAYILFFYFIGLGIVMFFGKKSTVLRSKIIPIVSILLLLIIPFWLYANNNLVLLNEKVISSQNTGDFISANLPPDAGIMAQPGYSGKLNYLTNHRIFGLHPRPEKLDEVIEYFDVSYVVVGRYYTYDAYQLSRDSVEFIRNSPDKFELVATVMEDYSDFHAEGDPASTDEVWIYRIKR